MSVSQGPGSLIDRSTLLSEFLKQFNEDKLEVLTGRSLVIN